MKKTILAALFFSILFTACKNQSQQTETMSIEENTGMSTQPEPEETTTKDSEIKAYTLDYLYKSDNGEILDVIFFEKNDKMHVKILRDTLDALIMPQTMAWAKGSEYEKENYKWTSREDNATFTDGTNTMKLVAISPLQYKYTNKKETIVVIYFSRKDKRFVTIIKGRQPEITLEQTKAWAYGADYGKGSVLWHSQRNKGVLIKGDTQTEYWRK